MSEVIRHKAYVKQVYPDSMIVTIVNHSACASCHAKGMCNMTGSQEKDIKITNCPDSYSPGDEVTILFKEASALKALMFGYIIPFILLLLTLIVSFSITENEGLSGLLALTVLIPYYITLYFFRDYLKKLFKFEIEETT